MSKGIEIVEVASRSPAAKAGIRPGDHLISINGRAVRDEIDLVFLQSDETLEMEYADSAGTKKVARIHKPYNRDLGIRIQAMQTMRCKSKCIFCFVDQNPPGLRQPLYFKDGDFRMSFLHGNYITANDLSDDDLTRIVEQRLSPLYVSVHSTNPKLRLKMLGIRKGPDVLVRLRSLTSKRIQIHAQVVLCPGYNDGEELQRTVNDLEQLGESLLSIAVVPVGLTDYRKKLAKLTPVTPTIASATLKQGKTLQAEIIRKRDEQILFFADEFYILADCDWPDYSEVEVVHQLENGVGMLHHFYKDFEPFSVVEPVIPPRRVAILTGLLGARALEPAIARINEIKGVQCDILPLSNSLFGSSVTVSGLLPGRDFKRAIQQCHGYDKFLIPGNALRDDEVFLDDLTFPELRAESKGQVEVVFGDALALSRSILSPI